MKRAFRISVLVGVIYLTVLNSVNGAALVVSNNAASGAGSFNAAIVFCNANAATAPHTITFTDAVDGLIIPSIAATALTCPNVTIDGTTMTNYACGNPRVMIMCNVFNGWQWTGSGCTIKGVRINGGIQLNGTGGHRVLSCLFNIDFAGAAMTTAAKACVRTNVATTVNNIIGGLTNCERNVMAAIGDNCIVFDNSGNGNQVLGNYMGTGITGLSVLGSGFANRIIWIAAGSNFILDGNTMGNVVSPAQGQAIFVEGGSGHTIRNNNIGANANRLFMTGFSFTGYMAVYFKGGNGSSSVLTNNVVGNCTVVANSGIIGTTITVESNNVDLRNNYIGCDINFNNGGSHWAGVYYLGGATGATIDGNYIGYNGILSAQRSHGLALFNIAGTFNITNNYIGVTPAGANMGNGDAGIELNTSTSAYVANITGNYIGFNRCMRATSPGSLISESAGIRVIEGETVNISNNYIGTLNGGRLSCGNLANGIGIEGATATSITINNNVIAYNGKNAIQTYGNGSDKVLISQNCIFCNTKEGIELSAGTLGSPTAGIGNASYGRSFATTSDGTQSVLISTGGAWASVLTGGTWTLRGYAPAGSTVEIFQIHHCNCDATSAFSGTESNGGRMQGMDYIGSVVTAASGRWSYTLTGNTVKNGFTVTASDLTNRRTSEFSPCVSVPVTCLPPTTVTVAGSTALTPCVNDPFTLAGSATFIRTSCYNNTYYTWLKDGVVIYGPSLTYVDYSVLAAADPADDGNYVLRVEDGNAALAACYLQSSPAVNVDVISCVPMTISLLNFSGVPHYAYNELNWLIETDEMVTVELQSAMDGVNFNTLYANTIGMGVSEQFKDFTSEAVMYYRLKLTPENGVPYYSKVITLSKNTDVEITLVNNNTADALTVQVISNSDEIVSYTIFDVKGIAVKQGTIQVSSGVTRNTLSVADLPSAMYVIRFESTNQTNTHAERFVKQ